MEKTLYLVCLITHILFTLSQVLVRCVNRGDRRSERNNFKEVHMDQFILELANKLAPRRVRKLTKKLVKVCKTKAEFLVVLSALDSNQVQAINDALYELYVQEEVRHETLSD